MQISGCGYVCSECLLNKEGICESCSLKSDIATGCEIMKCIANKDLDTCLRCHERYKGKTVCKIHSEGLRHCPLRIEVLRKREH